MAGDNFSRPARGHAATGIADNSIAPVRQPTRGLSFLGPCGCTDSLSRSGPVVGAEPWHEP